KRLSRKGTWSSAVTLQRPRTRRATWACRRPAKRFGPLRSRCFVSRTAKSSRAGRHVTTWERSGSSDICRPWGEATTNPAERHLGFSRALSRVRPTYNSARGGRRMPFDLTVNGRVHHVDADPQTPLLWIIRDYVGLTGTKFSCGIGQC